MRVSLKENCNRLILSLHDGDSSMRLGIHKKDRKPAVEAIGTIATQVFVKFQTFLLTPGPLRDKMKQLERIAQAQTSIATFLAADWINFR